MALNITEERKIIKRPFQLPVEGLSKLPPGLLKGKKIINIHADQLIELKNQQKLIILTNKTLKPAKEVSPQNQNKKFKRQSRKKECEELKRKIKNLEEQVARKEKEAEIYKREAQECKHVMDLLLLISCH